MIKSIKVKNFACFLDEQEINFFNFFGSAKNVSYLFGLPGTGKTSLFELIKLTIYYMKSWVKFSYDDSFHSINKELCLRKIFNANVDSIEDHFNNFTNIEIVFANKVFEYKYELSFNNLACNYENFYYQSTIDKTDWKPIFTKRLISCDYINNEIVSIFETKIEQEELQLDFGLSLKRDDLNDSVFSYVVSFDKSKSIRKINEILDNIVFLNEKDFFSLNNFNFPYDDFIANKEKILQTLSHLNFNFSDITVASFNKFTGFYELNLYLKNTNQNSNDPKFISSSKLSKEEIKILILALLYSKHSEEKKVIFIDEFSSELSYETFLKIQQKLENYLSEKESKTQVICFNSSFYNKTKSREANNFNIFNIIRNSHNHSSIKKIAQWSSANAKKEQEKDSLKSMVNLSSPNDDILNQEQKNNSSLSINSDLSVVEKIENDLKKEADKNSDLNQEEIKDKAENTLKTEKAKDNSNQEDVIDEQLELLGEDLEDESSLEKEFGQDFDWEITKEDEEAKRRLEHFFKNFKIK
ncbi:MAG: hypothetical protein K2H56_01350 [Malacoplasma sp.]|nr:hypothetical protein [Malacoplasma sp.]